MTEKGKCRNGEIYDANNDAELLAEREVCAVPEVTIGNNCVIGAGSIVTHNIPTNPLLLGILVK